jgi:hypothetical protein
MLVSIPQEILADSPGNERYEEYRVHAIELRRERRGICKCSRAKQNENRSAQAVHDALGAFPPESQAQGNRCGRRVG